jgi:hypothetical protein
LVQRSGRRSKRPDKYSNPVGFRKAGLCWWSVFDYALREPA